jgi:hypothetical protein
MVSTFDRIVKKLKKFTIVVGTSRSNSTAPLTDWLSCAMTAAPIRTTMAARTMVHVIAQPVDRSMTLTLAARVRPPSRAR